MAPRAPQERPKMCSRPPTTPPVRPRTPKCQCGFAFREILRKNERSFLNSSHCSFVLGDFPFSSRLPKAPQDPTWPTQSLNETPKRTPRGPQVHPGGPKELPRTSRGAPRSPKGVAEERPRAPKSSQGAPKNLEFPRNSQGPPQETKLRNA